MGNGRKGRWLLAPRLLVLSAALLALPVLPAGADAPGPPGEVVVKVKAASDLGAVAARVGAVTLRSGPSHKGASERAGLRVANTVAALDALRRDPRVAWAEPNVRYRAADLPDDPCLSTTCAGVRQWAPGVVRAPQAWSLTHGSAGVLVAVVDGGIDAGHVELAGKVVPGQDFTGAGADECAVHGTHVAGIVAAITNDGVAVAGLGWNTRVLDVRVLSYDPSEDVCSGSLLAIADGIDYAVNAGARVVNLSLAGSFDSQAIRESVARAVARGVVVVAAAGNDGEQGNPVEFPAAIGDVLSVGATTQGDQTAFFSNHGGWVDISAPGSGIVSTTPGGGYGVMSGTSMAAPHVAAAAALLLALKPGLSGQEVVARLELGSAEFEGAGREVRYGRLDMLGALLDDGQPGYYMVATDGGIFSFGRSRFLGSTGSIHLNQPIVAMAASPRRAGYWFVARDGGVFNYGDAPFWGSLGGTHPSSPIVGMAALGDGRGYFLFGADGQVYDFGAARVPEDAQGFRTKAHVAIVGGVLSPTGQGFWLVSGDGAVFDFGDAPALGSMAGQALNRPIVGITATPSGRGYWLVASDGGIFGFGDAAFFGSTGGMALNQPVVGMQTTLTGRGYWLVASDGGVFAYGDARFAGSMGGTPLNRPVVGIA
jgi:subtilisin family serine protease